MCSRRKFCSSACLARLNALSVTFNPFLRLWSRGRARSFSHTRSLTSHACRMRAWARGDSLKPPEEGRFGRRGSVSAAVWRKMSANVEAMGSTSGIPAAKVESGSLVTISCATVALQHWSDVRSFRSKGTPWCPSSGLRRRLGAFRPRRRREAETRRWSDFIFGWTVIFRTSLRSCWRTRTQSRRQR